MHTYPDMSRWRKRAEMSQLLLTAGLAVGLAQPACAQEAVVPVEAAAPTPAAGEAPAAQPATDAPALDAVRQTYQRLIAEQRYEEAVEIAGQLADLAARQHGERSLEHATALADLAAAQLRRGDLADAITNYKTSIALIERADGVGSPLLVGPLTGLGDAYVRSALYAEARGAYELALRGNHAAAGFYNLEQLPIMDGLSESYLGLNKLPEANAQQRNQVAIARRREGAASPATVPALYKLARWYNRTGQSLEARNTYQAARRIIRDSSGDNDPALVDSLVGESITYLNEGAVPASAALLKQALDLLDAQPTIDHRKRAEILVDLGDLYTLSRQSRSARQRYIQAWQELSGEDSLLDDRDRYFGRPARIAGPRLPDIVDAGGKPTAASGQLVDGYVLASLTVDTYGVARDPVIVESDPPGLLDKQLLRALQDTAFRPQMKDGETVASEGVQFRHAFRYLPAPQQPGETAAPPATDAAGDKGERINYPGQETDAGR